MLIIDGGIGALTAAAGHTGLGGRMVAVRAHNPLMVLANKLAVASG